MSIGSCFLYGILDLGYVSAIEALPVLEKMIEGGVDIVQLRAKRTPQPEIAALARILQPVCTASETPLIINDHPALASEVGANGVHLGQEDATVSEARRLVGRRCLVGKSTHSLAQAVAAVSTPGETPDYLGFGPLFATPTKPDYQPIGIDDIRRVHELVSIPIFCIGGIKRDNLEAVLSAGARRVVIVSGILQASDLVNYCRDVRAQISASDILIR